MPTQGSHDLSSLVSVCRCRHGESQWNLENRFTGWYNIQLSPKGEQEAAEGGKLIHEAGYKFGKRASTRAGFDCVAVGALAKCAALIATRGSVFSDPDVSSSRTCVPARAVSGISCSFTNKRDRFLLDMFSDLLFATEAFFLELSFSAASEPNVSITAPTPSQSNSAVLRHAARSQWRCSFSRTTGAVDHCCTASPFQSPLVMRTRIKYVPSVVYITRNCSCRPNLAISDFFLCSLIHTTTSADQVYAECLAFKVRSNVSPIRRPLITVSIVSAVASRVEVVIRPNTLARCVLVGVGLTGSQVATMGRNLSHVAAAVVAISCVYVVPEGGT